MKTTVITRSKVTVGLAWATSRVFSSGALAAATLCALFSGACSGGTTFPPPETPPSVETYDPGSGCQQGLAHIIELSITATGQGPSDSQRSTFLEQCVARASGKASDCVLALRRLPGRRGKLVNMRPVWRCLK